MSPNFKDITGQTFGCLKVIEKAGKNSCGQVTWLCECLFVGEKCKRKCVQIGAMLRSGKVLSCGCLNRERVRQRSTKHGLSRDPLGQAYRSMIFRVSPNYHSPENYYLRGITVCERWKDIQNFVSDMGPTWKEGLTLERRNNDLGYSPDNCYWADMTTQNNNKRNNRLIEWDGIKLTLHQWARRVGMSPQRIAHRLKAGWATGDALTP